MNTIPNTLRDIYFNSGETYVKNNVFHMNDSELKKYLDQYNTTNNTKFDLTRLKKDIDTIKKYPGKLYKDEYTRIGELEYLRDFCDIDNTVVFNNSMYKKKTHNNKENYRLMSYNIHSFINSCKTINSTDSTNTRSVTEISELCS